MQLLVNDGGNRGEAQLPVQLLAPHATIASRHTWVAFKQLIEHTPVAEQLRFAVRQLALAVHVSEHA